MNVCMCGTQAGYPHDDDCPFPLYRGSEEYQAQWREDRDYFRAKRLAYVALEAERAKSIADGQEAGLLGE